MARKRLSTTGPELTKEQYYLAVHLQFTYMAVMKPLRAGEEFLDSLCRNIRGLSLPTGEEESLTAVAIKAFGSAPRERKHLSCLALDAIEMLLPNKKTHSTTTP